jgi:hypothetical protein
VEENNFSRGSAEFVGIAIWGEKGTGFARGIAVLSVVYAMYIADLQVARFERVGVGVAGCGHLIGFEMLRVEKCVM